MVWELSRMTRELSQTDWELSQMIWELSQTVRELSQTDWELSRMTRKVSRMGKNTLPDCLNSFFCGVVVVINCP
jgi:hypothetical protein